MALSLLMVVVLLTVQCNGFPALESDDSRIGNGIDEGIVEEEVDTLFIPHDVMLQEALELDRDHEKDFQDQQFSDFPSNGDRETFVLSPDGSESFSMAPFQQQSVMNRQLELPNRSFQSTPIREMFQSGLLRHLEPPTRDFHSVVQEAISNLKISNSKNHFKVSPNSQQKNKTTKKEFTEAKAAKATNLAKNKTSDKMIMPSFIVGKKILVRPKNNFLLNVAPPLPPSPPPAFLVPPTREFQIVPTDSFQSTNERFGSSQVPMPSSVLTRVLMPPEHDFSAVPQLRRIMVPPTRDFERIVE